MIKRKRVLSDWIIDTIVVVFLVVMIVSILYPFLNSFAISLNNADDTTRGGITFYPRVPTLRNYELIFQNPKIYKAYFITVARTVTGTVSALFFTAILSFGLSRHTLKFKSTYTLLCLIPMYFSGGLMPTYFLIRSMGLINNFLVYIIPSLVGLWNMILMRSYFASLPDALEESARIDGANYLTVFFRIYFPISTPIIATISLYIGVYHWNDWFVPNVYITKQELKPMQSVLLSIISEARFAEQLAAAAGSASVDMGNLSKGKATNVRSISMATMIVTVIPIIMTYPFLQRYFVKGIMIGSIKG